MEKENDIVSFEPRFMDRLKCELLRHGNAVLLVEGNAVDGYDIRVIRSSDLHYIQSRD